jgi:ketosteroid isomerase-like protein
VTSRLALALSSLVLAGCVPWHRHPEEIVPRQSAARDTLLEVDLRRGDTLAARGWGALGSAYFADDIVYLRGGAPLVFGREQVSSMVETNPRSQASTTWQAIGGGLSRDRLSGYTFGIAVYPREETGAPVVARYIAFWQRRRGTPWKIVAYAEAGAGSPTAKDVPSAGTPASAPGGAEAQRAAAAIAAADSDFADDASIGGTAAAFENAAAPEAVIFGGPEIVMGPAAIHDLFDAQRGTSLSWHPLYARAAESGDLGFSIGESVATSRGQSGAAVQRFGKYMTVWRKQPNGDWKFVVDGGNARPSPVGR